MESLDVKPGLSPLKREPNADLGNQPINKLRRTDNIASNSSSPPRPQSAENEGENQDLSGCIKIESSESGNSYSAVQFESAINFKQEAEREQVSHGNEDAVSNPSIKTEMENDETLTSPSESQDRVKCKFPECKVICLNAEALERQNNSRHVAQTGNTNDNDESSDVIYSSTPPPIPTTTTTTTTNKNNNHRSLPSAPSTLLSTQESETNNKNRNATASSSSSSSAKNKRVEKSPSKFTCTICNEQFKDDKKLYNHKFPKHGILQTSSKTEDPAASNSNRNSAPKESVDADIMKNSLSQISGVSSTDKEFKCPVTSCSSSTFEALHRLEQHCLNDHRGQTFPWCGPDKFIKCPIKSIGCRKKSFNRQTGLEAHLRQVHMQSQSDAASSAAAACSVSGGGNQVVDEDEDPVLKCHFANCSFSCLSSPSLNRHYILHTGDTLNFKCTIANCGVAFFKGGILIKHYKEIHGLSDTSKEVGIAKRTTDKLAIYNTLM